MNCVCTREGLPETRGSGLRAELCQMPGNEAQHEQDICSVCA